MSSYRAESIILRNRSLGEHDVLITAISRERGKLRAVARAAKRPKSKLNGVIQPFDRVVLELYAGRSLDGVRGGEVLESFQPLRDNFHHISYASLIGEAVDAMSQEGDCDEALFWLTLTCFRAMERGLLHHLVLTFFLIRFLKVTGFLPNFERCHRCGRSLSGGPVFLLHRPELLCSHCGTGVDYLSAESVNTLVWLRDVHPNELSQAQIRTANWSSLRDVLLDYVEFHLDRPLNARAFLDILSSEG